MSANSVKISLAAIKLAIYPIGSIYTSVGTTSPATLFGGTWEAFGAGKVLVGLDSGDADFDTVGETGGAKTVAGDAHTHALSGNGWAYIAPVSGTGTVSKRKSVSEFTYTHTVTGTVAASSSTTTVASELGGATDSTTPDATSVVQPYIVVYFWKRTA